MHNLKIPFNSVILIDGNNLLHRSFHAYPYLTSKNGTHTGALYGTLQYLKRIQQIMNPLLMVFCMDYGKKTFRHELYPPYKGNRKESDDHLVQQILEMKEFAKNSGLVFYEKENFEADDVIGTLCLKYMKNGYFPIVFSGDKDLFQMVDDNIGMIYVSSKDGLKLYSPSDVSERFSGLTPKQIIDLKGLSGDSSDNYPGITGIGEKTAIKLLLEYGSIDGIYENIELLKGKTKERFFEGKEDAYLFKKIATIDCNVEDVEIETTDSFSFDNEYVISFLKKHDIKSI